MKTLFIALIALASLSGCQLFRRTPPRPKGPIPPFKFALKHDPQLDPALVAPGQASYLFHNLYRGLTRYAGEDRVVFDLAERCRFETDTILKCTLRKNLKWSDGQPLTAADFVWSFQHLLNPKSQCPVMNLIWNIKNAPDVFAGKKPASALGVKALSDSKLEIDLQDTDTEFLDKLSNPLLAAYKPGVYNGPYKIKSWIKNVKITLEPNGEFQGGAAWRPPVEIFFAAEDSAMLNLYEKGVINFLWRLTTVNIPKYRGRPDFVQVPQSRNDYIGFNLRPGSPFADKDLRKAFATSFNGDEFKKAFFALGRPGCPGILEPILEADEHCVPYNPVQSHLSLGKPVTYMFSALGGDDIKRQAEWFQSQWHEHLGVTVNLRSLEQREYRDLLKTNPPDAFRMGVMLTRPTCMAAMEKFLKGNPENYTGFYNARFERLAYALTHKQYSREEQFNICGVMSDILFNQEYAGIPLGKITFTLLASPDFQGWVLNQLNQLDLSQLTYTGKK